MTTGEGMIRGVILKALSGFYYVQTDEGLVECRGRGKLRLEGISPLVGDHVMISLTETGKGTVKEVLPRKNYFIRPSVANLEMMVIIASNSIPISSPFLIDRVAAIAELKDCEPVILINKCDIDPGDELFNIYTAAGFTTIRTSAVTGEGLSALATAIEGKICAFTGNSGVGKSSILNALKPDFEIETGEVSKKLGRGRHTTRHVELFKLDNGAIIADTPGFAAFDTGDDDFLALDQLQYAFREFEPYLGNCRFRDCAHVKETGCAILEALAEGKIMQSRHHSYTLIHQNAMELYKNRYD